MLARHLSHEHNDTYDSQTEEINFCDSNTIAKTLKCDIRIFMLWN